MSKCNNCDTHSGLSVCGLCWKDAKARIDELEAALMAYMEADEIAIRCGLGCLTTERIMELRERLVLHEQE